MLNNTNVGRDEDVVLYFCRGKKLTSDTAELIYVNVVPNNGRCVYDNWPAMYNAEAVANICDAFNAYVVYCSDKAGKYPTPPIIKKLSHLASLNQNRK